MKKIGEIKQIAWETLTKRGWITPIIVSMFSVLLSLAVNIFAGVVATNNIFITIGFHLCLYICIVYPFNMGLKIYMLKYIRGEEVSVGNVFDGYQFAIKMIPLSFVSLGVSWILDISAEMAMTGNKVMMLFGFLILLAAYVISIVTDFALYLIYDNDGRVFTSLYRVIVYMFKGGIVKITTLMLSYILWFFGIALTFGMLAFFVYPYMEASRTVLYEDVYKFLRSDKK